MSLKLSQSKKYLLLFTSLLSTFSASTSLTLAATFASSKAEFSFDNFSHNPLEIAVFTQADADTLAFSGIVEANAKADAIFEKIRSQPSQSTAQNLTYSEAKGVGSLYAGIAQSEAAIIGYDFLVESGKVFSFDFSGFLDLTTKIDNEKSEYANAAGNIFFQLFDSFTGELVDYLVVDGKLNTPSQNDYLNYGYTTNIRIDQNSYLSTNFGGNTEYATASVKGSYSRKFDTLTHLTLVEVKTSMARVKVPEPSPTLALLLLSLLGISYGIKNKLIKNSQATTDTSQ